MQLARALSSLLCAIVIQSVDSVDGLRSSHESRLLRVDATVSEHVIEDVRTEEESSANSLTQRAISRGRSLLQQRVEQTGKRPYPGFWGDLSLLSGDAANILESPPPSKPHHFWDFGLESLWQPGVGVCCVTLFLAGLLCSAGGIGGGGIYVAVLMVVGQLSVADAVPLSKAIVFFGSLSSLVLNLRKPSVNSGGKQQSLIDYNICRLVVPSALIGTYMGVLLNRVLPSEIIVVVLLLVLLIMSVMCVQTCYKQYMAEVAEDKIHDSAVDSCGSGYGSAGESTPAPAMPSPSAIEQPKGFDETGCAKAHASRSVLSTKEVFLAVLMLKAVIFFGVLRFHANRCQSAAAFDVAKACHHPVLFFLGNTLEAWMRNKSAAGWVQLFSFTAPCWLCCLGIGYYIHTCVHDGWNLKTTIQYGIMGSVTGCLAGLVGIGGGLIFSPFFLLMGVEPSIAVATSSTCVIFTSSSTTMQYLFTDRIIMSLTVVFGITNLLASYVGTSFVHFLHEHFSARKSYISAIVTVGLLISLGLASVKFVEGLRTK